MEFTQEEIERIKSFIPTTVKRRKVILDSIVAELNRRHFKTLDETDSGQLSEVERIVSDMYPEANERKVSEYSRVAIRLWKKTRS